MTTRKKRILFGFALFFVAAGGALAIVPKLLWGDGVDYSSVATIKKAPEYQDAALLAKAWQLPVAAKYQPGIDYQGNGSFCGPTSAVNVIRSLGQPADQATILEGTQVKTFFGGVLGGLTLDQMADVVRTKSGRSVTVLRDLDLAKFREHVAHANDPTRRYTINFHRGPLFAEGGGHHSPIAGYLAAEDLVLVLDVNKKYQPWLVKTERLFAAIDTVDRVSGKKRGLLLIE